MFLRNLAKMGANLSRKQIQCALSVFWNERIQENQPLHLRWGCLNYTADDHARVAVAYKNHSLRRL